MGQYQPSVTEMSEYTLDTSGWPDDRALEALLSQGEQLTSISEQLRRFYGLLPIDGDLGDLLPQRVWVLKCCWTTSPLIATPIAST
jgi:hypothetical protein